MKISIKELIIVHVCYRDVFNAPVPIKSLKIWMGIRSENLLIFNTALAELKKEGLIIEIQGYLACIAKEEIIHDQKRKSELTKQIIAKGQRGLDILSKIPFIRFVGISGSIAAENPTNDFNEKHIDLDLFVVTSKNTLWCFALLERIFTNLVRLFKGNHFYCFNYITEESFLEIYNKNFYTATELVNLSPICDKGVLNKFISCNEWIERYYDKDSIKGNTGFIVGNPFYLQMLAPFNYMFFALFGCLRSLKKFKLEGIRELKTTFSPNQKFNMHRISTERGGFQEVIKGRFEELLKNNFRNYYSTLLIEELFPNQESFIFVPEAHIDDLKIERIFNKYTLKANEKSSV